MKIAFIAALALVSTPVVAQTVHCTAPKNDPITITIDAMYEFGSSLTCIQGTFVEDMTPCAPNQGYGLSYPTGRAALRAIASKPADYNKHLGGMMGFRNNDGAYQFVGGYMSAQTFKRDWEFIVDRKDGRGVLQVGAEPHILYSCKTI